MRKDELLLIDVKNLQRLKNRLKIDISKSNDELLNESKSEYLSFIKNVISEKKKVNENMNLKEENMELVDTGDSVTYEVWKDNDGKLYKVSIERNDEEEDEFGEVRIERDFDNAEEVSSTHSAKFGESNLSTDDEIDSDTINEDGGGDGGGSSAGVAMANAGTVSGMGNVVSSQPSSTPGSAFTGDGTVGSGDIGMPLGTYSKKGITGNKYVKHSKGNKKKSKKLLSDVANFLKTHKKGSKPKFGNVPENAGGKVMNYQDFVKDNINQVKQASK